MDTSKIQEEADKVLSNQIYPLFAGNISRHLMSEQEIDSYWNTRTHIIRPHSYYYIFSYQRHRITHAKGLNILDGSYSYDLRLGPDIKGYIGHLLPEQQYLNVYEIRKVTIDIFNKYSDFFLKYPGEYALSNDISVIDHKGQYWQACQVIEPLVYNENRNLVKYFCSVSIGEKSCNTPFQSRIVHSTERGDVRKLKEFEIKLREIKKNQARLLGFSKTYMKYFREYLKGYSPEKIAKSNNHINGEAWRQARTRTNKTLKDSFPEMTKQYNHVYIVPKKVEHTSGLNTTITANILKQTGFINLE